MLEILIVYSIVPLVLGDLSLLLLHTNDMHARFEQVDRHMGVCKENKTEFCFGGFARLHYMVQHFKAEARAAGRSTLFLNAGDTFQGTPYYSRFKWKLVAKMINTLDIDVMTLGNHEFDDGIEDLASYIDSVNPHVVCSNLNLSSVPNLQRPNLTPSVVITVNGTKVGILGYLTPTTLKNRDLGGLKISEEISSIRKEAKKLREEGVQIIIALGHSGYDKDIEMAKKVEDIDVIVGGHTHTFLYSGKKTPELEEPSGPYPTLVAHDSGKQVPVVQAYFGTKYLGYLELDFDSQGNLRAFNGSPILLLDVFPQDLDILKVLEPYKKELDQVNSIIGYTHVLLDNNNFKCKTSECEIGNMIADAFTDYMVKQCKPLPISAGVMNAGGIRSSLDVISGRQNGSITIADIMTAIPWGKPVVVLNLPGKVILEMLEHAVTRFMDIKTSHVNNFLQVSGLRVTYNLGNKVGKQVTQVKILCRDCAVPQFERLDPEESYRVVVPEYLANGGEGFSMLTNITRECISNDVDFTIVVKYIETYSPINPRIEGRIKLTLGELNGLILSMIWYIVVMILIIFIFKSDIWTALYQLLCRSKEKSPDTSFLIVNCEYTKLNSAKSQLNG